MADRRPLISEPSDLSDLAASPPPTLSPQFRSRPGYSRLRSDTGNVEWSPQETLHEDEREHEEGDVGDKSGRRSSAGLGIAGASVENRAVSPALGTTVGTARRVSIQTIPRVPVGVRSPSTPGTGDPFLGGFPKDYSAESTPDLRRERFSPKDGDGDYEHFRRSAMKGRQSQSTLNSDYQTYVHSSDTERLRRKPTASIKSGKSAYDRDDFRPTEECPTEREFYQSRFTWLSVSILILCIFSTIFSGIFLGIALRGPRYGRRITTHGSLKPADAMLLTTIMAKLIELSFVTSFVAFLGQVLSRRAFMKEQGRGITLAEMSMWRWVVQPGTLITHWEGVRFAGFTVLGILSLLAATLATLYAPASTALVQPQLKFGDWNNAVLAGQVKASFANPTYVKSICQSPIRSDDADVGGSTCLQIEHAAAGYHNYQRYLSFWDTVSNNGNGTTDMKKRPQGFGLLNENTTITASWIENVNTTEISQKYNRAVNNVSLAMPHAGVFSAARYQQNDIIQPEELDGLGIYSLRASVPSPVLHVLCANLNASELKPIIYEDWSNETVDINTWPILQANATTENKTVVDDLFGWDHSDVYHYPPVFPKRPKPFNTIMNHTFLGDYGRDSIYLLGQGGKDAKKNLEGQFMLCQIKVSLTPYCSTRYNATGSGGTLEAICEDPDDDWAYIKSLTNATGSATSLDWPNIGFDWSNALSLNTGIMDGNASVSRLLTQLLLSPSTSGSVDLARDLPSPAEALAVMSGCTLLMSSQDTPFVEFYNYTTPLLGTPQLQYFNASLLSQEFSSGGTTPSSRAWMPVLFLVFFINVFVLLYFIFHRGLVTDFSEPPNLFTLAVNSPPSGLLKGSCGGGPVGKQYIVNWFVGEEGGHLFMEPGEEKVQHGHQHAHATGARRMNPAQDSWVGKVKGAVAGLRQRGGLTLGRRMTLRRPASMVVGEGWEGRRDGEVEMGGVGVEGERSRTYNMLAKRRSML